MGVPISTRPVWVLQKVCAGWQKLAPLNSVIGGRLAGYVTLHGRSNEQGQLVTEGSYLVASEDSRIQDLSIMLWLSRQKEAADAVICRSWDSGYGIGAEAIQDGRLFELVTSEESVDALSRRMLAQHYNLASVEDLEKSEEFLSDLQDIYSDEIENQTAELADLILEFAQEFRSEARDSIQDAFFQGVDRRISDFSELDPFDYLVRNSCDWEVSVSEEWQSSVEEFLLPIDFQDPGSVALAFSRAPGEHWKEHRGRVREMLKNLPDSLKNSVAVFDALVPSVAAWALEYAGPDVRSDRGVIAKAVAADLEHGYAASAFEYADSSILADGEFVSSMLDLHPKEYRSLPGEFRKMRSLAIKYAASGLLDNSIPSSLISDYEVLAAFLKAGPAFPYSSIPNQLHGDLKLARTHLISGGEIAHLPDELRSDQDLLLKIFEDTDVSDLSNVQRDVLTILVEALTGERLFTAVGEKIMLAIKQAMGSIEPLGGGISASVDLALDVGQAESVRILAVETLCALITAAFEVAGLGIDTIAQLRDRQTNKPVSD